MFEAMMIPRLLTALFSWETSFKLLKLYPPAKEHVKGNTIKIYGDTTHKQMFMCGTFVYYEKVLFHGNKRDIKDERCIRGNGALRLTAICK